MNRTAPYYIEMIFWCIALAYLAVINPAISGEFSFCPLHNAGFSFCPGCGIGRAISFSLHGEIFASVRTHVLGIPAAAVLVHRIVYLLRKIIHFNHLQRSLL
ncbi:MAG: DUF2752 domain-containing protein [Bacteriovoracaceae bacterium]|nr:DUF2752 domain-containing protein [Bacteroidota bacterium]